MFPPYVHVVNPRCCSYPLLMLSACFDAASLFLPTVVERWHGRLFDRCRSGGALGHGTGPWDDISGVVKRAIVVDFDMNARMQAVDEWMKGPRREPIMKRRRARRTARQLLWIQQYDT